jgi:cell division protein FtsN
MKKVMVLCAGMCVVLAFASCKSSESAYKKAYEKAKAQETTQTTPETQPQTPVVAPIVEAPATQTTVTDNYDNVTTRSENVTVVSGNGLKAYSVIVGSFSLKANAEGLQNTLKTAGFDSQIAYNADRNLYRVVASSFDDKASAAQSRDKLRAKYADAWLLYKK